MNKAIVIGSDAVNALGLVQSLGREGVDVTAILECEKSELIRHSNYAKEIIPVGNFEEAVEVLLTRFAGEEKIPVFPAGDGVALILAQNYERLEKHFLIEHSTGPYTIEQLMNKELQIELAIKHKFNVPYSVCISKPFCVPETMVYPCIVKPLVSCLGDKRDILIAQNTEELKDILENRVTFSDSVIIQQFIQRDYEYCMMGCAFKNGHVYIPLTDRPVKFNHKLQDTSYINYIEPVAGEIAGEIAKIEAFMKEVKYVGLFSVEFMHDKNRNTLYFTEINFRNDGTNSFIVHCGVNLPYLHYQDLLDLPHKIYTPINKTKKYIWEGIHFSNLINKGISFREWLSDLKGIDGFLYYFKDDKAPFFYQFANKILRKFHLS
ncbi:MAG: ATP-grasp domain-containing protein [Bacteroidales bacterium]|nr:ATP-grasp domain-containing protein [Bacteroidales bacterium]